QDLQWVVSAYAVAFGGFLLLGGRATDLFGRKRMFVLGLFLYAASSLAGGFAEDPWLLIAARAVQGLGGAFLAPATISLAMSLFVECAARNAALSVCGCAGGSVIALCSILGVLFSDSFVWLSVFYVNVLLTVSAMAVSVWLLLNDTPQAGGGFYLPGAGTCT